MWCFSFFSSFFLSWSFLNSELTLGPKLKTLNSKKDLEKFTKLRNTPGEFLVVFFHQKRKKSLVVFHQLAF